MQIKHGIKKEWMYLTRTYKLVGIVLAIIGLAVFEPLMLKGIELLGGVVDKVVSQNDKKNTPASETTASVSAGGEVMSLSFKANPGLTVSSSNDTQSSTMPNNTFGAILGDDPSPIALQMTIAEVSAAGLIIVLLLLMSAAGGEQKKRSVIIPNCAGLTGTGYAMPKFILYPTLVFVFTVVGIVLSAMTGAAIFNSTINILAVTSCAATVGLFLAFMVTLFLTVGICTGHPGLSALFVYLSSVFVPIILTGLRADKFHPFSLVNLGRTFLQNDTPVDTTNLTISIVVTLVLMVICILITLFTLSVKKINNAGNKAAL